MKTTERCDSSVDVHAFPNLAMSYDCAEFCSFHLDF